VEGGAPPSDREVAAALERELRQSVSPRATITALRRRPSAYRTSFPIEELDVTLDDGRHLELILKEGGRGSLREDARRAKPMHLYDPQREIEVYRSALASQGLGTATYYGAAVEAERDRYWLFIERVRGAELFQVGERGLWVDAARWLARAHSRFASDAGLGAARAHLVGHDAAYYAGWLVRAREFATADPERRRRIDGLAAAHELAVDGLLNLEPTMIHGEFYASNVIVAAGGDATRVCPVDWEVAGLGPGVIDLAALTAGWEDEAAREMESAYLKELEPPYEWEAGANGFRRAVDWARLHLAVRWLGWAPREWDPPAEHRRDWLEEAEGAAGRLGAVR
jgi:hypothetical protein